MNIRYSLKDALSELGEDLVKTIHRRMASRIGVNPRTGTNTLVGSKLYDSVDYDQSTNSVTISIADYWEFVAHGWQGFTGNFPHTWHKFLENLIHWIREKHIEIPKGMTESSYAYALRKSIVTRGIKARPFMVSTSSEDLEDVMPFLRKMIDEMMDSIFDDLTEQLENNTSMK